MHHESKREVFFCFARLRQGYHLKRWPNELMTQCHSQNDRIGYEHNSSS